MISAKARQCFEIDSRSHEQLVVIVDMLDQSPSRDNPNLRDPQAGQHTSQTLAPSLINGFDQ